MDTGNKFIPNGAREKQARILKTTPGVDRAADGAWGDVLQRRYQPAAPLERVQQEVGAKDADGATEGEALSVFSYNILADAGAKKQWYPKTPERALAWSHRKPLLMKEIIAYGADFVCLQEVDHYDEIERWMRVKGYSGVFKKRSGAGRADGCAIFVKSDRFELVRAAGIDLNQLAARRDAGCGVLCKDNDGLLAVVRSIATGRRLLVGTLHLFWDPAGEHVRLQQLRGVLEAAARFAASDAAATEPCSSGDGDGRVACVPISEPLPPPGPAPPSDVPVILTGDFNADPSSPTYHLARRGRVRFRRRPAPACDKGAELVPEEEEEADVEEEEENGEAKEAPAECPAAASDVPAEAAAPPAAAAEAPGTQALPSPSPSPAASAAAAAAAAAARRKAPRCCCGPEDGLGVCEIDHGFDFESAYERYARPPEQAGGPERVGEPSFTHWTYGPERKFTCDYIFYSRRHFRVSSLLQLPEEGEVPGALPGMAYPSDHLSVAARLLLLPAPVEQ
eukprot:tig00020592_g11689.t1